MKKQNEVRYIVTDVVSIPVFRLARKTEAYRQAVKPGWGTVEWYSQPEGDWKETYRAELPGTVEYQFKQEAARLAETAGATWMDADQQEQFRRICNLIDKIKSGRACMFLDPLHIEAADAVEIMAMDVVEVKHLEMELRTVVKAETAERLIRIFRKQPEEKQAAFIETTIKAARGGADYSTCQTIEDIANVFAKYFVESAGGV